MEKPSFLMNKPSFFKILMGDFTNHLKIPPAFTKNLGGLEGVFPKKYSISNSVGRCWSVEINRINSKLLIQNGWKEFVEDNSLEMGDFLVFTCWGFLELHVNIYGKNCCEKKVEFASDRGGAHETHFQRCEVIDVDAEQNATHFRTFILINAGCVKQNNNKAENVGGVEIKQLPLKITRRNQKCLNAAEAAKNFTSQCPHYKVVVRPTYIHSRYMYLPFCLKECIKKHQFVKLLSSNKTWTTKFKAYCRSCRLSNGWTRFVRDNNLKVGDICIFEIINSEDFTLKLSIFR